MIGVRNIPNALSRRYASMAAYSFGADTKKTTKLREMFERKDLAYLMEAHNGLSAKIVEETGFEGIWASGLSISASLGVRDSNEASWTQVLEVLEFMAESTTIPILLDGDTGYGNFNNARRLIQKLESRKVAGVCLEDKLFPKTNSFIDGELQPLAEIDEFCGKIRACKDTQEDPDFSVVARLEAFITGHGLDEALTRAHAYRDAGADAILCHSKKSNDSDIRAFMKEWGPNNSCPVIIVPTKYWQVPTQEFADMGVSTVIWANHNMRAVVKALQETTQQIFEDQSLKTVEEEKKVVPVAEVFRLQNTTELKTAEAVYSSFRPLTENIRDFLPPSVFLNLLKERGTDFFTGVPDSLLKDLCAYVTDTLPKENHLIAANEGTALATAAGHYLASGNIPVVYLQNSGLGNTINPLLSLLSPKVYSIPTLLLIGWRGEPGKKDEPQHTLQGALTPALLKEMNIPFEVLPDYEEGAQEVLDKAYKVMNNRKGPFALLVKKRTFDKHTLETEPKPFADTSNMLHREHVLEKLCDAFGDTPMVTTTGFTSREMFELRVRRDEQPGQDFLTVGSMGHCSAIALGVALANPDRDVVSVDGDGAAIMHLGSMVSNGNAGAKNLKHVLINNGIHDSVGGQPTGAGNVDFPAIALASGYKSATSVADMDHIDDALETLKATEGPALLEIRVLPGARADLGRPTTTPIQNKEAFMRNCQK